MNVKPGTQVAYVPTHALQDPNYKNPIDHPAVEFGFVTSNLADGAFVTYFQHDSINPHITSQNLTINDVRSRSSSESTPARCLMLYTFATTEVIDSLLKQVEQERGVNYRAIYESEKHRL